MKRILLLLLLMPLGWGAHVLGQSSAPVMVRTNGELNGRFTNIVSANLPLFRQHLLERVNGIAGGLTVTNGFSVIGSSTFDGEVAAKIFRVWGGATNRILYTGTNGVLVSLAGVDPQLLLHLIGLTGNVQAKLNELATNSGGFGVAATNGTAQGLTLSGVSTFTGSLTTGTNLASLGSGIITTTNLGNYPGVIATLTDVAITAPTIAANLAALKDAVVSTGYRLGVVLADTGSDGAAGDWYYDPVSTAPETAIVARPTGFSALSPGRWRKR